MLERVARFGSVSPLLLGCLGRLDHLDGFALIKDYVCSVLEGGARLACRSASRLDRHGRLNNLPSLRFTVRVGARPVLAFYASCALLVLTRRQNRLVCLGSNHYPVLR